MFPPTLPSLFSPCLSRCPVTLPCPHSLWIGIYEHARLHSPELGPLVFGSAAPQHAPPRSRGELNGFAWALGLDLA